jgi:hypothetical protein
MKYNMLGSIPTKEIFGFHILPISCRSPYNKCANLPLNMWSLKFNGEFTKNMGKRSTRNKYGTSLFQQTFVQQDCYTLMDPILIDQADGAYTVTVVV